MKAWKKALALLLAMVMTFSFAVTALADDETDEAEETAAAFEVPVEDDGSIVILYTNDVHTYIDKDLNYASIAAMKDAYTQAGIDVLLVDAGDHIQGTAYGSMDKGETILKLMNAAGYDLATLGNHEFDYTMEGAMNAIKWAEFPYVSCNFYNEKDGVAGDPVLDPYKVFEMGETKIAIIGITTPESFTKSTPKYFQDDAGNYIYGIAGGEDGSALYDCVQKTIDAASAEADIVIALGHLGDDPASDPWNSEDVIANTTGLDAFIDGHSHSTVPMKEVKDKDDNTVVLTQTGSYYDAIGHMVISAEGEITTDLITEFAPEKEDVKKIQDDWVAEVNEELGKVIGTTENVLDNYDADDPTIRLVRKQETNTGDFAADALYYLFDNMDLDVDVAIMNGGGIRNEAITGDLSYLTCKQIHTFGNVACLQTITGQQLLDALEWGAKDADAEGLMENGGFLQVSGLTYEINVAIPSTVQKDEKNVWTGGPTGDYRVQNVMVCNKETGEYEALDLTAEYNLAGYNYTLRDLGDGFAMFDGAVNVLDYVMEDYMVLANYIESFETNDAGLHVVTGYEEPAGRITIVNEPVSTIPAEGTAYPSSQTVLLDGEEVTFEMYALKNEKGYPTNYVKIRDLALAMVDSDAPFSVDWDDGVVSLVTGEVYEADGSENSTPFSDERPYTLFTDSTDVDGTPSDLVAFTLYDDEGGGYTYYQLRDLGRKLGFNVGWDSEDGIVYIESDKAYVG